MGGILVLFLVIGVNPQLELGHARTNTNSREVDNEAQERLAMAQRLLRVNHHPDIKMRKYDVFGVDSSDYDTNTGFSFSSLSTFHSNVWDRCLEWLGSPGDICRRWLDPYVSEHFQSPDSSLLEDRVGKAWQALKQDTDPGGTGGKQQYAIWDVEAKDPKLGIIQEVAGAPQLNRENLKEWRLKREVKADVENVGEATAKRALAGNFSSSETQKKADEKESRVMPTMESLRLMASRWTEALRRRMLTNLGEIRANQKQIAFALNEEIPTCEKYKQAVEAKYAAGLVDEAKLETQVRLDQQETMDGIDVLEQRYQLCLEARQITAQTINPTVMGDKLQPGNSEDERLDEWKSRLTLAAIDYGGIDLNQVPKPSYANLTKEDQSSVIREYSKGSKDYRDSLQTNGEQLNAYNEQLDRYADSVEQMSAYLPDLGDKAKKIKASKITLGADDLVKTNGLTGTMRDFVENTPYAEVMRREETVITTGPQEKKDQLEQRPSELTITTLGQ